MGSYSYDIMFRVLQLFLCGTLSKIIDSHKHNGASNYL
jgi:hypothetical protein